MLYLDPGAGSIALQMAIAAAAAGLFALRRWWTRITTAIRSSLTQIRRPR
jgi:hypothetical protein